MTGNTFGKFFRLTTCGESYSGAFNSDSPDNLKGGLVAIIDGVVPGIKFTKEMLDYEMNKRRPGIGSISSPREEKDEAYILSGIMENDLTTGAPIGIYIPNTDILTDQIEQHTLKKTTIRPGHSTYTYMEKYGDFYDYLGGGRSSGRETAARVAGGAVAKAILDKLGIDVISFTRKLYDVEIDNIDYETAKKNYRKNEINCPDMKIAEEMKKKVLAAKEAGDSLGGIIEIIVKGMPIGVGEPVFDKLEAVLSHSIMSIGAIKGIEFGTGFKYAEIKGSESNDIPYYDGDEIKFLTNNAGGILGGISTGEEIRMRVAVKPTPTIAMEQDTVNIKDKKNIRTMFSTRNDPTICTRIYPVCEAMTRIALLDLIFISFGYEKVLQLTTKDSNKNS